MALPFCGGAQTEPDLREETPERQCGRLSTPGGRKAELQSAVQTVETYCTGFISLFWQSGNTK